MPPEALVLFKHFGVPFFNGHATVFQNFTGHISHGTDILGIALNGKRHTPYLQAHALGLGNSFATEKFVKLPLSRENFITQGKERRLLSFWRLRYIPGFLFLRNPGINTSGGDVLTLVPCLLSLYVGGSPWEGVKESVGDYPQEGVREGIFLFRKP